MTLASYPYSPPHPYSSPYFCPYSYPALAPAPYLYPYPYPYPYPAPAPAPYPAAAPLPYPYPFPYPLSLTDSIPYPNLALGASGLISSRLRPRPPPQRPPTESLSSVTQSPQNSSSLLSWCDDDSDELSGAEGTEGADVQLEESSPFGGQDVSFDIDGFAGVFFDEVDRLSGMPGIPDRIALCNRATGNARRRRLFDTTLFKQFAMACPDRMQGAGIPHTYSYPAQLHLSRSTTTYPARVPLTAGFAMQRNKFNISEEKVGELVVLEEGGSLVLITEEILDSGLDEVHCALTCGGCPSRQICDLRRRPVAEDTVWEAHEPVALCKILAAAKVAGLAIAYFDIGHKAPMECVQVPRAYPASSHISRMLRVYPASLRISCLHCHLPIRHMLAGLVPRGGQANVHPNLRGLWADDSI